MNEIKVNYSIDQLNEAISAATQLQDAVVASLTGSLQTMRRAEGAV